MKTKYIFLDVFVGVGERGAVEFLVQSSSTALDTGWEGSAK